MLKSSIGSLVVAITAAIAYGQPTDRSANASQPTHQERAAESLFDFRQLKSTAGWIVVNDNVMGGRSEGGFALNSDFLAFSGSTNTDGGGFSSIRGLLPEKSDLAKADGIVIRLRTDDRRLFKVDIRQSGPNRALSFRAPLKTETRDGWQDVKVPFKAFSASWRGQAMQGRKFNPAAAKQIGFFIYDGQDGPFRLEIQCVSTYTED